MKAMKRGLFILAVLTMALSSSVTAFAADSKYVDVMRVVGGRMNVYCPSTYAYSDADGYTGTLNYYTYATGGSTYYLYCYYKGEVTRP
ncbi:hypothetical protein [Paenibacillus kobensis]|uniref:hypothetical protein n=1 Tax=Paenibacillus kobensis TaxID=59841 RepID=UPI000FD78680|nr:hypothetical protein [Paenibacillus kobensis]